MNARLVDRVGGFLADRLDRRSFLGRSAVVGSALLVAPRELALRPVSAYAAVCRCNGSSCRCGSLCCDGYTEFCCTLTGTNSCPPGTITGGWWKVDGSQFCGGAARFYLDCNAQCGTCGCGSNGVCSGACSGTPCGCALGDCDNRKSGCTQFRYGQCHQDKPCIGPIVCRIVTCTPPWLFDPACGTSSRTDNSTRFHDRPCAQEPFGAVERLYDSGGAIRLQGWAVDQLDYGQTLVRTYLDGAVIADADAVLTRADVAAAYPAFGPDHGFDVEFAVAPGMHLICVYAIDRTNGRGHFIGLGEVDVAGPAGAIDLVEPLGGGVVRVSGWAVDASQPGVNPLVRFRVDGQPLTRITTSSPRDDVAASVPGASSAAGFTTDLNVGAGSHQICADVIDRFGRPSQFACRGAEAS